MKGSNYNANRKRKPSNLVIKADWPHFLSVKSNIMRATNAIIKICQIWICTVEVWEKENSKLQRGQKNGFPGHMYDYRFTVI